jgi:hypothetical protein
MTFVLNESSLRSLERNICAGLLAALAVSPGAALAQTATPCEALAGRTIEPKVIGLASGPGTITSARIEKIAATPSATDRTAAYCEVLGEIAPRDPTAPPIRFEVNLPAE